MNSFVLFTSERVVAVTLFPDKSGEFVPDLGYVRAETEDGELLYALIPNNATEAREALAVPDRAIGEGEVLIESDFDYDLTRPGDWVLMVYEPDGLVLIGTSRLGRATRQVEAPNGTLFVHDDGQIAAGWFPWHGDFSWWQWLQDEYSVKVFPSIVPPYVTFLTPDRQESQES